MTNNTPSFWAFLVQQCLQVTPQIVSLSFKVDGQIIAECSLDNSLMTDVGKLTYLKSQLKSTASTLVSGLYNVGSYYEVATALLQEQFGNESLCIGAHIRKILTIYSL